MLTWTCKTSEKCFQNVFAKPQAHLKLSAFPHLWFPFWFCRRQLSHLLSCNTLNPCFCSSLSDPVFVSTNHLVTDETGWASPRGN